MNPSITLSVIIVNYNVREFLEQAIKSVADALVGISHELWVVDNASTDGSVESIRRQFPQVRLIANRKNVGFAGANNQALAQCTGQTICLLNPDTIFLNPFLRPGILPPENIVQLFDSFPVFA